MEKCVYVAHITLQLMTISLQIATLYRTLKIYFFKLSNSVMFSKIDLAHAYEQMSLDEKSSKILTLSTHIGLLMPRRLQDSV